MAKRKFRKSDRTEPWRGFGSMSPERKREIASMGGKAAHTLGTAHEWTSEEAREAGKKGGKISRRGRNKVKTNSMIVSRR